MAYKECENCGFRRDDWSADYDNPICSRCNSDMEEFEETGGFVLEEK